MLQIFRRVANSTVGKIVLGLIALAMVVTLYEAPNLFGGGSAAGGGNVARIDGAPLAASDVNARVDNALQSIRQQQPDASMAQLVADGGVDQIVDGMIDQRALLAFADRNGMVVSRRAVDGLIASIPAFRNPTGQFDQTIMRGVLSQRGMTEAMLRDELSGEIVRRMVLTPVTALAALPASAAEPYARGLLEKRDGQVAAVPVTAFPGATPTPAEVDAFYKANGARYQVPERRALHYAVVDAASAPVAPVTDADIAAFQQKNPARFAAREDRAFSQVIVPDQATAQRIAAAGAAGFDAAVKAAGRSVIKVPSLSKDAFAKQTSPAVADAAFLAAKGTLTQPLRSGLGFHVVRVDSINATPAQTLAQARPAIQRELEAARRDGALAELAARIDEAVSGGAGFADVVKQHNLTAQVTPLLTADGIEPGNPRFVKSDALTAILKDAFQGGEEGATVVSQLPGNQSFAVWKIDRIAPAAPRALAEITPLVANDFRVERATRMAKQTADAIADKVRKGMPLAQAVQQAGVPLPAPVPGGGVKLGLMQAGAQAPFPVVQMFALKPGEVRVTPLQQKQVFFIVKLDKVTPATGATPPQLVAGMRQQLGQAVGQEYLQQMTRAIRASVDVRRDDAAVAALKRTLTQGAGGR